MTDLESFAFGDSPALADELLELVLTAKNNATCWAVSEGDKGVEVGKRWIMKDGQGRPRAILETVEVNRRRIEEVDGASRMTRVRATGGLLITRRAHTDYFTRRGEFQPGMEVYCERFRRVEVIEGFLHQRVAREPDDETIAEQE